MGLTTYNKIDSNAWEMYKEECLKTESLLNPLKESVNELGLNSRILHCVIGISTEIDEYNIAVYNSDNVNALEELGDMLWYLAMLDVELDYFGKCVADSHFNADALDACKKTLFYGKELDSHRVKYSLSAIIGETIRRIELLGSTPLLVMDTNINKLKARYPDKFTPRDAEVRDLEKERKILEKGLK